VEHKVLRVMSSSTETRISLRFGSQELFVCRRYHSFPFPRLFISRKEPVSCRWFAHARVVVRDDSCPLQRVSNSLGRARWTLAAELVLRKHSTANTLCLIDQRSVAHWIQDHATHTCTLIVAVTPPVYPELPI